jgi:hypothetical protein
VPANTYTTAQRQEAIELYRTEGPTAVEKKLGILKGTVTKWAKAAGVETVSVANTRAGTEAASVYAKSRRAELARLLLDDAHRLRAQLWQPARLVNFGGKDNTLNETTLDEPLFVDKKNIMSAVSTAAATMAKLEAVDTDNGVAGAVSMLDRLVEQIGGLSDDGGLPEATPVPPGQ